MIRIRPALSLLPLLGLGCAPEATTPLGPPPAPQVSPALTDVANRGDGRDLQVTWIGEEGDGSWRLYVLPEGAAWTADDTPFAEGVGGPAGEEVRVVGLADAVDHAGDPLHEDQAYVVVVTRVRDGAESAPSAQSAPVTLRNEAIVRTLVRLDAGTGGLEVDDNGVVYMGDFGPSLSGAIGVPGEVVYRITPDGDADVFARGQQGASGNALDADGNLVQSSIAGGYLSRIRPDGVSTPFASGLSAPVGVAVHEDGTLYVANCGNGTVTATDPTTGSTVPFADDPRLRCPNGIALASDDNLYVANFNGNALVRVRPTGEVEPFVTLPGSNLGHVTWAGDRLIVAVRSAHQLAEVTLGGEVTILAGTGVRGRADGPADQATLSLPNDVALSPDGTLVYFNDVAPSVVDTDQIAPTLVRVLVLAREPQSR